MTTTTHGTEAIQCTSREKCFHRVGVLKRAGWVETARFELDNSVQVLLSHGMLKIRITWKETQ